MADLSVKKVFKQHSSVVVTLPVLLRRDLGIERGDHLVFEWDPTGNFAKVYKWHRGVKRRYADYGTEDLRHQGGGKQSERGAK